MDAKFITAAGIAARQNGRITLGQLRDCGIGKGGVEAGVRSGRLHRVHVGVFALGHLAPSRLSDWHAAVLACGPDACLSHRCASTGLRIPDGVGPRIDVTVPKAKPRRRPGIEVHRADLDFWERGTWCDIPITSPSRTLVDLAHELKDPEQIEWAVRQIQFRRLYEPKLIELSLRKRPNRTLTQLLDGIAPTRSPLEIAFLHRVVRRHHLPTPEVNVQVEGLLVDFVWRDARLVVETDGHQHDQPWQRAADAFRDALLGAAGYRVLRFRWADVHVRDAQTACAVRNAVASATAVSK